MKPKNEKYFKTTNTAFINPVIFFTVVILLVFFPVMLHQEFIF